MTCKYFKTRKKNNKKEKRIYYYCSKQRCEINYIDCRNCHYKKYKEMKPIKKRTYKQAKIEKNRFNILYNDLTKCCVCESTNNIELNEIYEGSYRQLSIKYGMVAPLCNPEFGPSCHKKFHITRIYTKTNPKTKRKAIENNRQSIKVSDKYSAESKNDLLNWLKNYME